MTVNAATPRIVVPSSLPAPRALDTPTTQQQRTRAYLILALVSGVFALSLFLYLLSHCWLLAGRPLGIGGCEWYPVNATSGMRYRAWDWVLWSLLGTMVFAMREIAEYFRKLAPAAAQAPTRPELSADFVRYTPWYIATLFRGPFLSLAILLLLSSASFGLTDPTGGEATFTINVGDLDHRVAVALAAVLGYYHRVARNVLDGLVKRVFGAAWAELNLRFEIAADRDHVPFGESLALRTVPANDVLWSASQGAITESGVYTAPASAGAAGTPAVITATAKGAPLISKTHTLTLVPFRILGPDEITLTEREQVYAYSVSPGRVGVKWSLIPSQVGQIDECTGVLQTVPKGDEPTGTLTVMATVVESDGTTAIQQLRVVWRGA